MADAVHTVEMFCLCENGVEDCVLERYVSDVRMATAELSRLRARLEIIAKLAGAS